MTIAVIVACKDSFYIVVDTLTQITQVDSNSIHTLNNQKVFFSGKHKIGLCVAGQANLIDKNASLPSIYVSHVVREFFNHLDTIEIVEISNLESLLIEYVDGHYPRYHNYFKFQNPGYNNDKDVSYFYAGFTSDYREGSNVIIYSHHEGLLTDAFYKDPVPYFSNYQIGMNSYINFGLEGAPADRTTGENLIELLDKHKKYVITKFIPQTCFWVNNDRPYTIGEDLHCKVFKQDGTLDLYFKHNGIYGSDINNVVAIPNEQSLIYNTYRTVADTIDNKEQAYYNGKQYSLVEEKHIQTQNSNSFLMVGNEAYMDGYTNSGTIIEQDSVSITGDISQLK